MSFPNSGTSFTSKMIRHLSKMSTASNYGDEVLDKDGNSIPMFDSNGPFWIEPPSHPEYTRPTLFALTKTHCGGRCDKCGPSEFVETPHSFLSACLTGKITHTSSEGKVVKKPVTYSIDLVQRGECYTVLDLHEYVCFLFPSQAYCILLISKRFIS